MKIKTIERVYQTIIQMLATNKKPTLVAIGKKIKKHPETVRIHILPLVKSKVIKKNKRGTVVSCK